MVSGEGLSLRLFVVLNRFHEALAHPRSLIAIHRELEHGSDRRSRSRHVALNRGAVVLAVAAWQAFAQDAVTLAVDMRKPKRGQPTADWQIKRARTLKATNAFATPDAKSVRNLMLHVGFDPWPAWHWTEGPKRLTPPTIRARLNAWLRVRHALAHGSERMPEVSVLTRTRNGRSLQVRNAEACVAFFDRLGDVTAEILETPRRPIT